VKSLSPSQAREGFTVAMSWRDNLEAALEEQLAAYLARLAEKEKAAG